jgi:hypothetical protein
VADWLLLGALGSHATPKQTGAPGLMHSLQGPGPSPHGASRKSQGALPARALMACGDCPIPQHHHTDPPPHSLEPSNCAACCMGPALWVSRDAASGADTAGPPSTNPPPFNPRESLAVEAAAWAATQSPHFTQAGCWVPYSVSVPYLPCLPSGSSSCPVLDLHPTGCRARYNTSIHSTHS